MDTKCAVRTCVLSENWRYSCMNIHSLNFCRGSFLSSVAFHGFVTHVLHHHNNLNLVKLKFYYSDGDLESFTRKFILSHDTADAETKVVELDKEFFNLNGIFPLLLSMDKCPALEKVNIHMSPSAASWDVEDMMQEFETDNSLKQEMFRE
ncbi:hypothetical protein QYF36_001411 [Acer negundo]|nr:hypothetical protein QYF36_001411 [Acer negundo]